MSTEEQLVNCVCHIHGFIQTYLLFNLLIKHFWRNQFSKDMLKKQWKAAIPEIICPVNNYH